MQAASDSLAAAGTELAMETVQANLPLLAARENLSIAESAINNHRTKEASAALKEAAEDLKKFADSNPPQHVEDARKLSTDMESFAQGLRANENGASGKVDGWWHEVDAWFNRPSHA